MFVVARATNFYSMGALSRVEPAEAAPKTASFTLNGRRITAAADDPSEPPIYVLRNNSVCRVSNSGAACSSAGVASDGTVAGWKFDSYTPTPAKNENLGGDRNAQNSYGFANKAPRECGRRELDS